jgi:hypothetical protein
MLTTKLRYIEIDGEREDVTAEQAARLVELGLIYRCSFEDCCEGEAYHIITERVPLFEGNAFDWLVEQAASADIKE